MDLDMTSMQSRKLIHRPCIREQSKAYNAELETVSIKFNDKSKQNNSIVTYLRW